MEKLNTNWKLNTNLKLNTKQINEFENEKVWGRNYKIMIYPWYPVVDITTVRSERALKNMNCKRPYTHTSVSQYSSVDDHSAYSLEHKTTERDQSISHFYPIMSTKNFRLGVYRHIISLSSVYWPTSGQEIKRHNQMIHKYWITHRLSLTQSLTGYVTDRQIATLTVTHIQINGLNL